MPKELDAQASLVALGSDNEEVHRAEVRIWFFRPEAELIDKSCLDTRTLPFVEECEDVRISRPDRIFCEMIAFVEVSTELSVSIDGEERSKDLGGFAFRVHEFDLAGLSRRDFSSSSKHGTDIST